MAESVSVVDIGLRLIGVFYALAGLAGVRNAAVSTLLSQAIAAIGNPDPRETRAERERGWFLAVNILLVALAGIALAALLDVAAWLFAAGMVLYSIYLFVLAPRRWDPHDRPEEPGRSKTWNAFWIYLLVTVLVLAAWWTDRLTPVAGAHPLALAAATALGVALVGYALRMMLRTRLGARRRWSGLGAAEADDDDHPADKVDPDDLARIRQTPLVMRPSWGRGAFFDALSGEPVSMPICEEFTFADESDISRWLTLFAEVGDRADPRRCALRDPRDLQRLDDLGRPIFERLVARMGPARLSFEPSAAPVSTRHRVRRIKLMADYPNHAIWAVEDDRYEAISPDELGISWQLALDISAWEIAHAASHDPEPDAPSRWSEARHAAHEEQGRRLAVRLARELAATGRADIIVYTYVRAIGIVPVRPEDPIDWDSGLAGPPAFR